MSDAPVPKPKLDWTPERVEQLRDLHSKGLTCSQIAKVIGHGVTRNAIIGKVHRLGLKRDTVTQPRAVSRPRGPRKRPEHPGRPPGSLNSQPAPAPEPVASLPAVIEDAEVITLRPIPSPILDSLSSNERNVPLLQLQPGGCRYPTTDEVEGVIGKYLFCNALCDDEKSSYCRDHVVSKPFKPITQAQRDAYRRRFGRPTSLVRSV